MKVDTIKNTSVFLVVSSHIIISKGVDVLGAPKGKKHRVFTQEQKIEYVERYLSSHMSTHKYAEEVGIDRSVIKRWVRQYTEEGADGLASHRDRCGNPYAALHTSKSLDRVDCLELRMAKMEADIERLKKGYQVKGSGSQKEFVIGNNKSFKS